MHRLLHSDAFRELHKVWLQFVHVMLLPLNCSLEISMCIVTQDEINPRFPFLPEMFCIVSASQLFAVNRSGLSCRP